MRVSEPVRRTIFVGVSSNCVRYCYSLFLLCAFHLQRSFFTDTWINWQHLCHPQGDIPIDPYTSISYPDIATFQEKYSENHDSSLISDFQVILIIVLLWEKVILFFF